MQVRCRHCNRPYAIKRDEVHAALDMLHTEDLVHYNSYCPHCGKINRLAKKQLKRQAPTWEPSKEAEETKE
jgi:hypothetical protein